MTDSVQIGNRTPLFRKMLLRGASQTLLPGGFLALFLWFFLSDPRGAADSLSKGLSLSVSVVIPSLFPFLVLSGILTSSGFGETVGRLFQRPMSILFGIRGAGASALLLGSFCGFPIGARVTADLLRRGEIGKTDAERLLPLCNSPSFAFLTGTVGSGLFGSRRFGLLLYGIVLLSGAITGILRHLCSFRRCPSLPEKMTDATGKEGAVAFRESPAPKIPLAALLTTAISGGAATILSITGFVVFFSVVSAAMERLFLLIGLPGFLPLLFSGLVELSGGCRAAALFISPAVGRGFAVFFAGFGGLSAHLQVLSVLPAEPRLSFPRYFGMKFLQGGVALLLYFGLTLTGIPVF